MQNHLCHLSKKRIQNLIHNLLELLSNDDGQLLNGDDLEEYCLLLSELIDLKKD